MPSLDGLCSNLSADFEESVGEIDRGRLASKRVRSFDFVLGFVLNPSLLLFRFSSTFGTQGECTVETCCRALTTP